MNSQAFTTAASILLLGIAVIAGGIASLFRRPKVSPATPPPSFHSQPRPVYATPAERLAAIALRLRHAEAEAWELAIAGAEVTEIGPYVYRPHGGAVAICPRFSMQFSAAKSRMDFIAHSGRDIRWLLDRCRRLETELADTRAGPGDPLGGFTVDTM